jgi:protein TonB
MRSSKLQWFKFAGVEVVFLVMLVVSLGPWLRLQFVGAKPECGFRMAEVAILPQGGVMTKTEISGAVQPAAKVQSLSGSVAPAAESAMPNSISMVITPPQLLGGTMPPYPEEAIKNGEEGEVLLNLAVGLDGRVQQVKVKCSSGSRFLDQAAARAAEYWKFIPAKQGTTALRFNFEVPVCFSLK